MVYLSAGGGESDFGAVGATVLMSGGRPTTLSWAASRTSWVSSRPFRRACCFSWSPIRSVISSDRPSIPLFVLAQVGYRLVRLLTQVVYLLVDLRVLLVFALVISAFSSLIVLVISAFWSFIVLVICVLCSFIALIICVLCSIIVLFNSNILL